MATQPSNRRTFDDAIATFRAEIANAAAHGTIDAQARLTYDRLITAMSRELSGKATSGQISWQAASEQAHGARNATMNIVRTRSTPVGRAIAESLKREGRTLNELVARKTMQLFGNQAQFARLSPVQQNRVYAAIIEAAGRSNPQITALMRNISYAGRGLLVASLAYSVYAVATSDDPARTARREGAVLGSGIAGGAAGGALAGLVCGPGAPVCVTVGAFVGGALAAFGVSTLF